MASSNSGRVLLDEIPAHLKCQQCAALLKEPRVLKACGHTLCAACTNPTTCPVCATACEADTIVPSTEMAELVALFCESARFKCAACEWTGSGADFTAHQTAGCPGDQRKRSSPPSAPAPAGTAVAVAPQPAAPVQSTAPVRPAPMPPVPAQPLGVKSAVTPVPSSAFPRGPAHAQQLQQAQANAHAHQLQQAAQQQQVYYAMPSSATTAAYYPGYGYSYASAYAPTTATYAVQAPSVNYASYGIVPYAAASGQAYTGQPYGAVYSMPTTATGMAPTATQPVASSVAHPINGGAPVALGTSPADQQLRVEELCRKVSHLSGGLPAAEIQRVARDATHMHADDQKALGYVVDYVLRQPSARPSPAAARPLPPPPAPAAALAPVAAPITAAPETKHRGDLQIFWDLDNIPIPPEINARIMYSQIVEFFVSQKVIHDRTAVYTHIYFVDPTGDRPRRWCTPQNKEALRSMGCVLVSCTTRKEDADRQMTNAMLQLITFNTNSPVVVISSDKDFTPSVQRLRKHGNEVYVIHDAPRRSEHEELLKFSATATWRANDIVQGWTNANRYDWSDEKFSNGGARFQQGSSRLTPPKFYGNAAQNHFPSAPPMTIPMPASKQKGDTAAVNKLLEHFSAKAAGVAPTPPDARPPAPEAAPTAVSDPIAKLLALQSARTAVAPPAPPPAPKPDHADPRPTAASSIVSGPSATPYSAPAVASQVLDGAPVVVVDGALWSIRHLDMTDGLDDLIDAIGDQSARGSMCPEQWKCKRGRQCDKIHMKHLKLNDYDAMPTWMLLHNAAFEQRWAQQRGLAASDGTAPRFCGINPAGHGAEEDAQCAHLHDRYVIVEGQPVALFTLIYNNAVFAALRGSNNNTAVTWCDGCHAEGTTETNCDRLHARTCCIGASPANLRMFQPNAALRNHVVIGSHLKQCAGHSKKAHPSELLNCVFAHPRRLIIQGNEINPWEFVDDATLYRTLDLPREVQNKLSVCPGNHGVNVPCKLLHRVAAAPK